MCLTLASRLFAGGLVTEYSDSTPIPCKQPQPSTSQGPAMPQFTPGRQYPMDQLVVAQPGGLSHFQQPQAAVPQQEHQQMQEQIVRHLCGQHSAQALQDTCRSDRASPSAMQMGAQQQHMANTSAPVDSHAQMQLLNLKASILQHFGQGMLEGFAPGTVVHTVMQQRYTVLLEELKREYQFHAGCSGHSTIAEHVVSSTNTNGEDTIMMEANP